MHKILDYMHPLSNLLTPGVFSSDHFLPFILMEWSETAGMKDTLCPDLDGLIELLKTNGYSLRDANSLGMLPEKCLQNIVYDVLWVHHTVRPLWEVDAVIECSFQS